MPELLSFIVPAHNESLEIGPTLRAIRQAASALDRPYEIIVVNDASTDDTAAQAKECGARVIEVQLRKISAVRNAGAQAAKGSIFFFVDADTRISAEALKAAI